MIDKLSDYGHNFQVKVIASLFVDRTFLQQTADILDVSYFESESSQWIIEQIQEYFVQYKKPPTLDVMKVQIDAIENKVLRVSIIKALHEAWNNTDSSDLDFIKEKTLDFCKNQCIKQAILKSVDKLKDGNYEQIKVLIDDAMKAGMDTDVGLDYKTTVAERYTDQVRSVTETPWDAINSITDGGFGKGELIVFVAPAGIGKSMGLVNVGAHYLKNGLRVAHYTLELSELYVGLRYDAIVTGIPNQNLKFNQEEVHRKVEVLPGELNLKYWPTKTATVNTIRANVDKMTMLGQKPDVIIIDYADLLRGPKGVEKRLELDSIYEELRGLAGEFEVPVFTASQANRSALEQDIIEADKISESYGKVMIADFIISLSRKVTDKIAGTGRWHIIKNRFGPDGMTFPSNMNMANCRIEIYEESSFNGQEAKGKMQNSDEFKRKRLSQKYKEINGDTFG